MVLYSAQAAMVAVSSTPPTTLGISRLGVVTLPGSSRSGENATSTPSRIGSSALLLARITRLPWRSTQVATISSVVPG
jgi:hypothetical protein